MPLYKIYFPSGHADYLTKDISIASTNSYEDMLHYVDYYWYNEVAYKHWPQPLLPIYVKVVK